MRRALPLVGALVAAQALLLGLWLAVERSRRPAPEQGAAARPAPPSGAALRTTPLDRPLPDLELRRPDGSTLRLREARGRPLVLHFWATFCPPCREELPRLLAQAERGEVTLLAVSLDPSWPALSRFFGGEPPPEVVLASASAVEEGFDVRTLPVTFLVSAEGVIRLRLDGARDWASDSLSARLRDLERP